MTKKLTSAADNEINSQLDLARQAIASTKMSFRDAAEHIAKARDLKAPFRQIAEKLGMSPGWVHGILKWRSLGHQEGGPFAKHAQVARKRKAGVQSLNAHPEPPPAMGLLPISMTTRVFEEDFRGELIKVIQTSCPEANSLCDKWGFTLEELIVPSSKNIPDITLAKVVT